MVNKVALSLQSPHHHSIVSLLLLDALFLDGVQVLHVICCHLDNTEGITNSKRSNDIDPIVVCVHVLGGPFAFLDETEVSIAVHHQLWCVCTRTGWPFCVSRLRTRNDLMRSTQLWCVYTYWVALFCFSMGPKSRSPSIVECPG